MRLAEATGKKKKAIFEHRMRQVVVWRWARQK